MSVWARHDDRDQALRGRGEPARLLINTLLGVSGRSPGMTIHSLATMIERIRVGNAC